MNNLDYIVAFVLFAAAVAILVRVFSGYRDFAPKGRLDALKRMGIK